MEQIGIWECPKGHKTAIPEHDLLGMSSHRKGSPTDNAFVDFVCPECGLGTRLPLLHIPTQPSGSKDRYLPVLFHIPLRCDEPSCEVRTVVHTLAGSDATTVAPKKAEPNWKLDGIRCYEGHPVTKTSTDREPWLTNV
jgi:hypothetical protein